MTKVALWAVGGILGAAVTTVVAWVGLVWWFGEREPAGQPRGAA